ncbi:hypothetical protein Tco_1557058 [Tanacetum coccineum]
MDIVAERAARKAAKSKVQSSLKPSPVAGDDEKMMILLSQFAPKKKKQIFATDFAEKLVRSTRVDFIFKVNFLMLFANVMGKVDTMRAFVNLSVVRRIHEDTNIVGVDWCDFIHRCLAISLKLNTDSGFYNGPLCFLIDLEIEDEAFGKLEFYGEWSENETVEAEGFCEYASVLPHTRQRRRRLKSQKPAENVKELAEKPKEPVEKAQKAPQNVKPKPAAVKTKEAAKKPKPVAENVKELAEKPKEPAKNVKELTEKPKEPAKKAQKAPQNVKPKPAAVKTKEAAEKPKPAENVKELAEKPKEPAEKAQKAPQNVKPKPAAVKTKEAAEKPKPTENVKELAEKPKEPAGDDYQVVRAATVMKVEDCEEFEDSYPCLASLFDPVNKREGIHDQDVYRCETVFQSLGGYRELSSVRVNMETLAPTLWIDANNQGIIKGTLAEEEQWKSFLDEIKAQFKYEPSSMSLSDFELKKLFSMYLKEQNHKCHEVVAKMRPFIPKLKWRTSNNHVDCGVFAMIHMENYVVMLQIYGEFVLCEESDETLSIFNSA